MRIAQTLGGAFKIFADTFYEEAILADWDNKVIKKTYSEGPNSEKGRISAIEYCFISEEWDRTIIGILNTTIKQCLKNSLKEREKIIKDTDKWEVNRGFNNGLDWVLGVLAQINANHKNKEDINTFSKVVNDKKQ